VAYAVNQFNGEAPQFIEFRFSVNALSVGRYSSIFLRNGTNEVFNFEWGAGYGSNMVLNGVTIQAISTDTFYTVIVDNINYSNHTCDVSVDGLKKSGMSFGNYQQIDNVRMGGNSTSHVMETLVDYIYVYSIVGNTGTSGTSAIATRYPVVEGLIAEETKQTGRQMSLIPQSSLLTEREQVGI
jgi:hypothetical protein